MMRRSPGTYRVAAAVGSGSFRRPAGQTDLVLYYVSVAKAWFGTGKDLNEQDPLKLISRDSHDTWRNWLI